MDEPTKKPPAFSDRAMDQYVQAYLPEGAELSPDDRTSIKVTFRTLGGKWEDVVGGSSEAILKLTKSVEAWVEAQSPQD